jgi:hypothetical protein
MKTKERIFLAGLLLLMLFGIRCNMQAQAISLTQDPKLAFVEDDYGNKPYTADLRMKVMLTGNEMKTGYATVNIVYEYADLQERSLNRYGVQAGYTFYTFADGLEITPLVGYGVLMRGRAAMQSWEFEADVTWWFSDHFGVLWSALYTQRPEWDVWRYSNHVGIKARL